VKKALIALVVVVVLGTATAASGARSLSPQAIAMWDRVARCETGGNWRMHGSVYSGGVGFANTTWTWWARELGLLSRYPTADRAPRLTQMLVADYGLHRYGDGWGCPF